MSFILGAKRQTGPSGSLMRYRVWLKKPLCEPSCESSGWMLGARGRVIYLKAWQEGRIVMKQVYKNTPVVLDSIIRRVRRDADPSGFTIRVSKTAGEGNYGEL